MADYVRKEAQNSGMIRTDGAPWGSNFKESLCKYFYNYYNIKKALISALRSDTELYEVYFEL